MITEKTAAEICRLIDRKREAKECLERIRVLGEYDAVILITPHVSESHVPTVETTYEFDISDDNVVAALERMIRRNNEKLDELNTLAVQEAQGGHYGE
jgi:hypothetical protein